MLQQGLRAKSSLTWHGYVATPVIPCLSTTALGFHVPVVLQDQGSLCDQALSLKRLHSSHVLRSKFLPRLSTGQLTAMASTRYFPNTLPDYDPSLEDAGEDMQKARNVTGYKIPVPSEGVAHDVTGTRDDAPYPSPERFRKAALDLKDKIVAATWHEEPGRRGVRDPFAYTGLLGTAFLCLRCYEATGERGDLQLCLRMVEACAAEASAMRPYVTFLCGQPGIYALGAVASNFAGDHQGVERYLGLFNEVALEQQLQRGPEDGGFGLPQELLFGRAGFLWAALFVNAHVGAHAVPWSTTGPVVEAILSAGRAGAATSSSPLMYTWHGTRYLGAAHGLAGILHVLLHFPLSEADSKAVKEALGFLSRSRLPSGNYPSSEGNGNDRLVHWCHGAPGVALTFCKAAEAFSEGGPFLQAALEASDVVWERGLLRRLALCHGVSGNAYVFLALHRLTGGKRHLHRARAFGAFLHDHWFDLVARGEMRPGDRPYSLFEGLAGMACLWLDLSQPEKALFPCYELPMAADQPKLGRLEVR